jgi:hypothetical protein
MMKEDNKNQKTSLWTSVVKRGGFGLFKKEEKLGKLDIEAKYLVEKVIKDIDKIDKDNCDQFYSSLRYYLGGLIAGTYEAQGDKYIHARFPRSFFKNREQYEEGYPGISTHVFDHFAKRNGKFVCHLYDDINDEELRELLKWADERGINFSISAESNYFPARTIQIEFSETTLKAKDMTS